MKKVWIFLGGMLTGGILTFLIVLLIGISINNNNNKSLDGAIYFEQPKETITSSDLTVFQTLDKDFALVKPYTTYGFTNDLYLLYKDDAYFYDDQHINTPANVVYKEIGRYTYTTRNDTYKTVPIIQAFKK